VRLKDPHVLPVWEWVKALLGEETCTAFSADLLTFKQELSDFQVASFAFHSYFTNSPCSLAFLYGFTCLSNVSLKLCREAGQDWSLEDGGFENSTLAFIYDIRLTRLYNFITFWFLLDIFLVICCKFVFSCHHIPDVNLVYINEELQFFKIGFFYWICFYWVYL
jgi:hypothetical protein